MGGTYESISREIFLDLARQGNMPVTSLGRWWSKNEEVDLVAVDEESRAIRFGECNWKKRSISAVGSHRAIP